MYTISLIASRYHVTEAKVEEQMRVLYGTSSKSASTRRKSPGISGYRQHGAHILVAGTRGGGASEGEDGYWPCQPQVISSPVNFVRSQLEVGIILASFLSHNL
jgi:hypothetical protein